MSRDEDKDKQDGRHRVGTDTAAHHGVDDDRQRLAGIARCKVRNHKVVDRDGESFHDGTGHDTRMISGIMTFQNA